MTTEETALAHILAAIAPLSAEAVPLAEADGRYVAQEIRAHIPLPGFDNSAMDGYAVRAAEAGAGALLRLAGEQPAGASLGLALGAGEAIRIFTGAPLPAGADAVVMQEDTRVDAATVEISGGVEPGENIRRAGSDLCAGQSLVATGEPLTPPRIGVLASQGFAQIAVARRPRVAILATGDELAGPGEPLAPGRIHESNTAMLAALIRRAGALVTLLGIAPDEPARLRESLRAGLHYDALVVCGGVSVGARDFVKQELAALGVALDLWRVAIKPGKPFAFGRAAGCSVFGLPGNPVSAFVTALCFVRPAILKMQGALETSLPAATALAAADLANPGDRPHYLRGWLADGKFTPAGRQESHALFGLSQSNAIVLLAPGTALHAGDGVTALLF
jgi:molybdopterin molybdotransferase